MLLKEEKQQNQEGNRVLSSKQKEELKKSVGEKLRWILDLFIEKIYNPKKERQEVFFDCDWHSLIDLHSYGHDIETAWQIQPLLLLESTKYDFYYQSHFHTHLTRNDFEQSIFYGTAWC